MHQHWLKKTLVLAKERRGFCSPNPSVGAIVVRNDELIAKAYHYEAGKPHAEFQALTQLRYPLTDATLYISLEPCSHFGKTPPCVDEIIRSGIKKVVYAFSDPNPLIEGFDTIGFLREKGIDCVQCLVPEITAFYESYAYWVKTKLPFVTLKIAQSLNGKIALSDGKAVKLTGQALNEFTHQKRRQADVILTTARTLIMDNPQLNVRLTNETTNKPIFVLDRQKSLIEIGQTLQCLPNVLTIYYDKALTAMTGLPFKGVPVSCDNKRLNLVEIIQHLGQQGIQDVWVEAGGQLATAMLNQALIQRLYVYISGQWLGSDGIDAYIDTNAITNKQHKPVKWQQVGADMLAQFEF